MNIATFIIAIISMGIALADFIWSIILTVKQRQLDKKSFELNEKALKIQEGQIELEMANQLSTAKKYVDSWDSMLYSNLTDEEKKKALLTQKRAFVIEEALNCYEVLCQKYLDDKADKDRFKKAYKNEIANLFSSNSIYKERLDGQSSPYKAIKKVYEEWENPEN